MAETPTLDRTLTEVVDEQEAEESNSHWARLLSLTPGADNIILVDHTHVIGRAATCDTVISGNRLISSKHCTFTFDEAEMKAYITDSSTNGTLLNGSRLPKGKKTAVNQGDEVTLAKLKSDATKNVYFAFHLVQKHEHQTEDDPTDEALDQVPIFEQSLADPKGGFMSDEDDDMDAPPTPAPAAAPDKATAAVPMEEDELEENMMCSICREVFHDCVSLVPCLHSFCAGCYSDWMSRSKDCPDCRSPVDQIRHNHTIRNLVEAYLKQHPDKKRPAEDIEELDEKNKITSDILHPPRKRRRYDDEEDDSEDYSESDEEDDEPPPPITCRSCLTAVEGFQCPAAPAAQHVTCRCCFQPMPRRNVPAAPGFGTPFGFGFGRGIVSTVASAVSAITPASGAAPASSVPPQYCSFCKQLFCNLYWKCPSAVCQGTCLLRLKDVKFTEAELGNCVNANVIESGFLKEYLKAKNITPTEMFQDCVKKLDTKEFKCTKVPDPTSESATCKPCARKILSEVGYQYRAAIDDADLPAKVTARPDCWYGKNCRTQHNPSNLAHAQKLNHVCDQTKY